MFDEQPKVVDMFDGTEKSAAPPPAPAQPTPVMPIVPPTPPAQSDAPMQPAPHHSPFGFARGVLLVILILVLIGGAGFAAWKVMSQQPSGDGPVRSVGDGGIVAPDDDEPEAEPAQKEPKVPEGKATFIDSDGDGLTNAEELEAGTDVGNPDTDSDGLGDREEVKVYGTDPLNPDTDGDTFLDGQEVAGGYNPNGDGKLFNVPTE